MTNPQGIWGGQDPSLYEYRIKKLEAEVQALRERGTRDAGAFNVRNADGKNTFWSGPSPTVTNPDGSPQWVTYISEASGKIRLAFYDPFPLTDGFIQVLWEWDHLDNLIRTTDKNGGWAEPWFSFSMYPKFEQVDSGVFGFMSTPVNVAEQTLWEGRIGYVTHPYIQADLQGGSATGTNTTRYRLKINGAVAQTWDVVGGAFFGGSLLALGVGGIVIGSRNVGVSLTAQSLSGSGTYACQVWGMHMRQTP